ncbi:ATP-binding protein [Actinomadura logoneensis]|uniref:ATP-binding protein n=1 Tax=Actinomadura logoneensis TaxID=2293572 RepID=A0A372JSS7_9ACTN|nr:ATP-binding protein [Actinomadura logoneensis]RFU42398.1 ATP-binding protein [Actinomadura logoneensis]
MPRPDTARPPGRRPENLRSFEQSITGLATAAVLVRDLVEAHLIEWGIAEMVDDAILIADELFTNAIRAAPGRTIGLRVVMLKPFLLIELEDPSPKKAAHRKPDDEGGRGLLIVEALSIHWGQRAEAGGTKTVYALLAIPNCHSSNADAAPSQSQSQPGAHSA